MEVRLAGDTSVSSAEVFDDPLMTLDQICRWQSVHAGGAQADSQIQPRQGDEVRARVHSARCA